MLERAAFAMFEKNREWPTTDAFASFKKTVYMIAMATKLRPGQKTIADALPLARAAAHDVLEKLASTWSSEDRGRVVTHGYYAGHGDTKIAVFEWYIPGRTQRRAKVLARAVVDLSTNQVTVDPAPTDLKRRGGPFSFALLIIIAPIVFASILWLIAIVLPHRRISLEAVPSQFALTWLIAQFGCFAIAAPYVFGVLIRLPTGGTLLVHRTTSRARPPA